MVRVCANKKTLAETAAQIFVERFELAMDHSQEFSVVLSGGSTPSQTYRCLAQEPFKSQIDWRHVHVFWGDERCVPTSDLRSNYGTANRILLSQVPIPTRHIHPILCTNDSHKAAIDYENHLKRYFGDTPPLFDLVFFGLGQDGHTASLFPGSPALYEKARWAVDVQKPTEEFRRITLTTPLLNKTKMALFLVTGQAKAQTLKEALSNVQPSRSLPARLIHPAKGALLWLVDSSAAAFDNTDHFEELAC